MFLKVLKIGKLEKFQRFENCKKKKRENGCQLFEKSVFSKLPTLEKKIDVFLAAIVLKRSVISDITPWNTRRYVPEDRTLQGQKIKKNNVIINN
jgi:hypothetical protein